MIQPVDTSYGPMMYSSGGPSVDTSYSPMMYSSLSRSLTYLGDIVIPGHQLNKPCTLHFDEQNHCLYITDQLVDQLVTVITYFIRHIEIFMCVCVFVFSLVSHHTTSHHTINVTTHDVDDDKTMTRIK